MYSRILVPIDGGVPSSLGLLEAIKLSKALNASITLLHVVDFWSLLPSEATAASYDGLFESLRRTGAQVLKEAALTVSRAGIAVDATLVEASDAQVGDCILRKAQELHAELIVCGTHGRRGIRRLLMGSDAEHIVRNSKVPVLLVREQESAQLGAPSVVGAAA